MIRKIVIAFILVILLAVVSYVKTIREEHKINQKLLSHQTEQKSELISFKQQLDSLTSAHPNEVDSQRIDSLLTVIAGKDSLIASLDNHSVPENQPLSQNQDIYNYYQEQQDLISPAMSITEKETALTILKEETARKYSITIDELEDITKQYNLE